MFYSTTPLREEDEVRINITEVERIEKEGANANNSFNIVLRAPVVLWLV